MAARLGAGAAFGDLGVGPSGPAVVGFAVLAGAGLAAVAWGPREGPTRREAAGAVSVAFVWLAALALLHAVGVIFQPWYLVAPAAAFALAVGGAVHGLVAALGESRGAARIPGWVALAGLALGLVGFGRASPLVHTHSEWREASDRSRHYLAGLAARIERSKDGAVLLVPSPPVWVGAPAGRERLPGVVVLSPYAVEAWAHLALPGRDLRFEAEPFDGAAASDEVVVVLRRSRLR
jgi:hypothetical protein